MLTNCETGARSLGDSARKLLGLPPKEAESPLRRVERCYPAIIAHVEKLYVLQQKLYSPGQWRHCNAPPSWSEPEVQHWFDAERGSQGEGFLLWNEVYSALLDELPETMRAELDPHTNWTMRNALSCQFRSFEGKPVNFLCDEATDTPQTEAKFAKIDTTRTSIQQRLLPQLIPDFARSLIPEHLRGRSWEEICKQVPTDPKKFLPPNDLHEGRFPDKVQSHFAPVASVVVRGLLATLAGKGNLPIQEVNYCSPWSGRLETGRYYWPAGTRTDMVSRCDMLEPVIQLGHFLKARATAQKATADCTHTTFVIGKIPVDAVDIWIVGASEGPELLSLARRAKAAIDAAGLTPSLVQSEEAPRLVDRAYSLIQSLIAGAERVVQRHNGLVKLPYGLSECLNVLQTVALLPSARPEDESKQIEKPRGAQPNVKVETIIMGDQIISQGSTVTNRSNVNSSFTVPVESSDKAASATRNICKRAFAWFGDNIVAKVASGLIVTILVAWITGLWPWIKRSLGLE